jgi:hypothetical protein
MDISEKPQFEIDIKQILLKYRTRYKSATGYDIYHRIYRMTELIGKLGSCQENINAGARAIWDGANHITNLGRLAKLKEKFELTILELVKNWVEIANILKIPDYIEKAENLPFNTLGCVETLMTEDSDSTESINVLFYIYFLIENISEFAIVCKTLCELSGDTADISVDIVSVEEVREHEIVLEREEEFTEEEIYISNLEFFMTFMTLLKLIAVKSGIDFEASIQRLFKK